MSKAHWSYSLGCKVAKTGSKTVPVDWSHALGFQYHEWDWGFIPSSVGGHCEVARRGSPLTAFTWGRSFAGIVESGLEDEELGSKGERGNVCLRGNDSNYCAHPISLKTVLGTFFMT